MSLWSVRRGSQASRGKRGDIWKPPSLHGPKTQNLTHSKRDVDEHQRGDDLVDVEARLEPAGDAGPQRTGRDAGQPSSAADRRSWACPPGSQPTSTTAEAPQAPIISWPSAPMFQRRMRKATEQARPVKMSGVALTRVSESTPTLPSDGAHDVGVGVDSGSPPMSQMSTAEMSRATTTAPMVGRRPGHAASPVAARAWSAKGRQCRRAVAGALMADSVRQRWGRSRASRSSSGPDRRRPLRRRGRRR